MHLNLKQQNLRKDKMKDLLLIYNARLVDKNIDVKNGAVLIKGKEIAGFPEKETVRRMLEDRDIASFDAGGLTLMPSFIDMHAHFRDPGQTQKEDIESGVHAAAAGGFGTCVLMPNTMPVVSSAKDALGNNKKAEKLSLAQVIQSVSITKNFDGQTLSHLANINRKDIPLITEDGKEVADSSVMLNAMKIAAKKNIIVSCHCEDPALAIEARPLRKKALQLLRSNKGHPLAAQKKEASDLLAQANALLATAEDVATFRNIRLAQDAKCHLHLCHVSTAACIDALRKAKEKGINVTAEVTPHHITLTGDRGDNRFQIVNPPLRNENDRQALIKALKDGTVSCIATDHAPHTAADKASGSPGFSGLETAFASCYTTLCMQNGFSLRELSALMSANPAELLGLTKQGLLADGYEANLVLVNTEKTWTVRGDEFASRGKYTPLEGKKLTGFVEATVFRGKVVFQAI